MFHISALAPNTSIDAQASLCYSYSSMALADDDAVFDEAPHDDNDEDEHDDDDVEDKEDDDDSCDVNVLTKMVVIVMR